MDTPVVNGTAYPSLPVEPTAFRFQVLNAANDRAMNLGLYVADPLAISITSGGSGYAAATPPVVTISGCASITTATAAVDANGGVLGVESFATTPSGFAELHGWVAGFGPVARVGVEGTGAYGAGLAFPRSSRS